MTGNAPRGQTYASELMPWAISIVAGGFLVMFGGVWLGGTLGAALTGAGWQPPPFTLTTFGTFVSRGPGTLWPGASPTGVLAGIGLVFATFMALVLLVVRQVMRFLGKPKGLAGRRELAGLAPAGIAARARELRPSLKGREDLHPDETGNLLGDLDPSGPELRSSYEDVELDLMAPRAGKSTGIAVPRVLRAHGAVLLTSNKSDVYAVTRAEREKAGTVWTFDPQGIAHAPREMWWDILADCHDHRGRPPSRRALRRPPSTTTSPRRTSGSPRPRTPSPPCSWPRPATRRPCSTCSPGSPTPPTARPSTCCGTSTSSPWPSSCRARSAARSRPATASTRPPGSTWPACSTRRSSPGSRPTRAFREFRPDVHVLGRDTLYLLSKDGGGSAAGVIAGLADATLRAAVVAAERTGGRLDPPMTAVLDEAANVCRISDLPDLYSHLGSRGIIVVTMLQSYRQGSRVWGEAGMDALWSAATIKLIGAGLDDADFVDKISRLVGDHDVQHPVDLPEQGGHLPLVLLPAGPGPAPGHDPRPPQGHRPAPGHRRTPRPDPPAPLVQGAERGPDLGGGQGGGGRHHRTGRPVVVGDRRFPDRRRRVQVAAASGDPAQGHRRVADPEAARGTGASAGAAGPPVTPGALRASAPASPCAATTRPARTGSAASATRSP